jgi:Caspase domain
MHIRSLTLKHISVLCIAQLLILPLTSMAQKERPASRQLQQIGSAPSWPSKQKRWAMVIGVDQYADTQITTLGGAANDARSLADALVRYGGFPQDQVFLMSTDQPAERQPTRGNILRRLSNMRSVVPADGLLLISFAGHGIERSGQAFLLPSDAQVANDIELLEQTAINVTQLKDSIHKTGVGQVVLILDACRNDPVGRGDADNPLSAAYLRGFNFDVRNREVTAFATLYATAVGHRAYEYKEKHQGYFTWELVEGLKGGAANEKGEVTLEALIRYVQDRVPKHVLADLGAGKEQKPFAEIGGYRADQLVIAVAAPRSTGQSASNTGEPTTVLQKVDPAAVELAYWEAIKNSTDPEDFKSYLQKYPNGQFAELARRRANPTPATANPQTGNNAATSNQRNPTGSNAQQTQTVLLADILVLGINMGMAEVASYRNTAPVSIMQYLATAQTVAGRSGFSTQGIDYVVRQLQAGATSQSQYQNLFATRQGLEQVLNRNCNCGSTINLLNVFTLGAQIGFMEVTTYQNGDRNYVAQLMTNAANLAPATGLPAAGLQDLLQQLRSGKHTKDVYQPLVNLRTQFVQLMLRNCAC